MRLKALSLLFFMLLFLTACGLLGAKKNQIPRQEGGGILIDDVRPIPPAHEVREFTLNRAAFRDSFTSKSGEKSSRPPIDQVRLIQIFDKDVRAEGPIPRYRLFKVKPDSPYGALGLESGDVIVAADGWVIFQPVKFKQYVSLLQTVSEAEIEIIRDGKPYLMRYRFVGE